MLSGSLLVSETPVTLAEPGALSGALALFRAADRRSSSAAFMSAVMAARERGGERDQSLSAPLHRRGGLGHDGEGVNGQRPVGLSPRGRWDYHQEAGGIITSLSEQKATYSTS